MCEKGTVTPLSQSGNYASFYVLLNLSLEQRMYGTNSPSKEPVTEHSDTDPEWSTKRIAQIYTCAQWSVTVHIWMAGRYATNTFFKDQDWHSPLILKLPNTQQRQDITYVHGCFQGCILNITESMSEKRILYYKRMGCGSFESSRKLLRFYLL